MAVRCEICGQAECDCMSDPHAVELALVMREVKARRAIARRRIWFGGVGVASCGASGLALAASAEPVLQAFGTLLFLFGGLGSALVVVAGSLGGLQTGRELRRLRSRRALPAARLL